ncbi:MULTISPECIES: alanine racemase [unclassified Pseudoclavibacter]|jgi:alanine racemase|uniref:alanine racemase n=1 Tax=unclassified Pseudoclavibacter TaxID=2615177 RepID=UPI000CE895AB|nr:MULTISPECIES: alanine racemase [unclassified Pseudoclavibacter]MBS3179936.1 alanine racemase [Pseudoclavibacter sp. Marseille-Q4354]PPG33390.1 alanine racemase [Pseudoclavibacter sp. RFBB5]
MTTEPVWVEVDLDAIEHNLQEIQREFAGRSTLCIVLKADAYGHGIDLLGPVVIAKNIEMLGISSNREAAQLRALGFTGRLLRLRSAQPQEMQAGVHWNIEEWIGGFPHATTASAIATASGRSIPVHLSVNSTGITREGIDVSRPAGLAELRALASLPGLDVRGIATHFPLEDQQDIRAGTARFVDEAETATSVLREQGATSRIDRHCATSYAGLTVPESRLDLVRIGAALYGDTAADPKRFRRAMTVRSRVAAVNGYSAGETVGYERTHVLERDSVLASVPVGYGDGFHRSLGGRAQVLIRGKRAPVIDLPGMNCLIIDVTEVHGVFPGDDVVLYGRQGGGEVTSHDLELANTQIAADLYTAWGRILPRFAVGSAARRPALAVR